MTADGADARQDVRGEAQAAAEEWASFEARFVSIETGISRIDGKMAAIEGRMTGIEAKLAAIEGRFTVLLWACRDQCRCHDCHSGGFAAPRLK